MTIGQRIAQKRKELNLSQEALGEQLGVSRQSIYKWESDAALPEIDKLITLSRLFGVSVGWLLGVEENSAQADDTAAEESSELTETQLKMVQEITDRYIAAQPKPAPRKKWPWVLAALVLIFVCFNLFGRLKELNRQYNSLQNSVSRIDQNVSYQIYGISNRVEEILKQQNNLTAEYGSTHLSTDCAKNTASFEVWAVPRTYVEGMRVTFTADNGHGITEAEGALLEGQKFQAEIISDLSDLISLSVVFESPDGVRQTQRLDVYYDLFSETMPSGDVEDSFMYRKLSKGGTVTISDEPDRYVYLSPDSTQHFDLVADLRVGLFKNQTLVAWAEPCDVPSSYIGFDDHRFFALPTLEIPMAPGEELRCAAIVTDIYGRESIFPGMVYVVNEERNELMWAEDQFWDTDPANWHYE